uniref:Uncharacterized protein n=1 Tax=Anguilla anguilla TaxID=7936 RepID=A0A0E9W9S5_ANGAN
MVSVTAAHQVRQVDFFSKCTLGYWDTCNYCGVCCKKVVKLRNGRN